MEDGEEVIVWKLGEVCGILDIPEMGNVAVCLHQFLGETGWKDWKARLTKLLLYLFIYHPSTSIGLG